MKRCKLSMDIQWSEMMLNFVCWVLRGWCQCQPLLQQPAACALASFGGTRGKGSGLRGVAEDSECSSIGIIWHELIFCFMLGWHQARFLAWGCLLNMTTYYPLSSGPSSSMHRWKTPGTGLKCPVFGFGLYSYFLSSSNSTHFVISTSLCSFWTCTWIINDHLQMIHILVYVNTVCFFGGGLTPPRCHWTLD